VGTLTALNTAVVRSKVDGELKAIRFTEGRRVKAGELLAEIDPRPFEVQVLQAQGQLAKDQALLKNAELDGQRYRELWAQDAIAKAPIHFQSVIGSASVSEVVASIRAAVRKHWVKLVLVDYLQKIRADGQHEKRTYKVSGALKSCAVSTDAAMVALAQVNRDSEKGPLKNPVAQA
jgi:multidrug efflux pump subunit AcrA (membrane-fusion protein)